MAERMLASSELVSAQKTSTLSMFSSTSSSSSAASPTSTIELLSCSEILRARFESRSITLTWFSSSSVCASRKPMLPPPAITTRLIGSSSFCISFMTTRMSCVAATKKTSSPSSITVSPSGSMLSLLRYMAATRASLLRMWPLSSRIGRPTSAPPFSALIPTRRTLPSAKSTTCNAPG